MTSRPDMLHACAFHAADHCFAIDSACVAEVLHAADLTRVPLAPAAISGLLHLRGRIVPVIDVRRRLGLPAVGSRTPGTTLVVRVADDWYGLLVDDVLDVRAIPGDRIERPGPAGSGATAAVTGVFAAADTLVHILDPERVVKDLHVQRPLSPVTSGAPHGG